MNKFGGLALRTDIPRPLYYKLTRWDIEERKRVFLTPQYEELLLTRRIVAVPNFLLNALLCEQLQTMFSASDLLGCPGFIKRPDGAVRLDIDKPLVREGFMFAIVRGGLIRGLRIYRHPSDRRPFTLSSR